jgi:hypothetical protein
MKYVHKFSHGTKTAAAKANETRKKGDFKVQTEKQSIMALIFTKILLFCLLSSLALSAAYQQGEGAAERRAASDTGFALKSDLMKLKE